MFRQFQHIFFQQATVCSLVAKGPKARTSFFYESYINGIYLLRILRTSFISHRIYIWNIYLRERSEWLMFLVNVGMLIYTVHGSFESPPFFRAEKPKITGQ